MSAGHPAAPDDGAALRVGFIGLGSQGGPMARRIAEAGFRTRLWARRPETLAPFADLGVEAAGSPAELGSASDVVCVCVVDDAGVDEVVDGPHGILRGMQPGGVVVVHSTVHPDTCRRLGERAAQRGVALLDAPVSGGGQAAAAGSLMVMAAGDERTLARCRPVLDTCAAHVLHLGPIGAGQIAKILNNTLLAANLAVAHSAYDAARALGLDPGNLALVLAGSSGASLAATAVLPGSMFDLGVLGKHAGALLHKDVGLFAELMRATDARPGTVMEIADRALAGLGHPR
ncbi:NAD(P)-binding domain-containing protein [Yinghuangia sp. ASG 101]|uniref:NAD(P)-dependent oxidoreductase n=1 Tax=Yinghuangia sp. ASG 101 TaxID=2896848 RepID=UPI001E64D545|nr:NAD(P)-binding domain-containing protein [Yinghuangia sp. ASG 101]UGQ11007.1 NAD(P)-binding domain-containing protein [Yinghuangia sp. ASG 101]